MPSKDTPSPESQAIAASPTGRDEPSRRLRDRLSEAVATVRDRQPETPPRPIIVEAPASHDRHDRDSVPPTVRAASEWTWRLLLIAFGVFALFWLINLLAQVTYPVIIAVLLAALLQPIFARLNRVMPRGPAAGITVLGTFAVLVGLISFVVNQLTGQMSDLVDQVGTGIEEIRAWALSTFNLSEGQLTSYLDTAWARLNESSNLGSSAAQAGLTAGHVLTGMAIAMFTLFFFLFDGPAIWAWIVRLFPRSARANIVSGGRIAWGQLQAFTRATILVAGVDALGIGLGAFALGVPFASGIALLVFLGAFVPVVGALVSGFVAVILALVAKGPLMALAMLGVVLLVQQIESHLLQPLLLGRAVRVHPLAVILAIAAGIIVGGIFGALVAVPLVAVANAVGHHLLDPEPREVESPDELLTPAEQAEVEAEVEESEAQAEIEPGESPYES